MRNLRKLTAIGVATAMLATPAAPAFAGGYSGISVGGGYGNIGYGLGYGRSWGGFRRNRHRDRVDAGDVIGAIAVIGVIAAVASAASKNKQSSRRDRDEDRYPDERRGSISSEDQAVDACAVAAENKAGESSSVRDITEVRKSSDGWDVEGMVEERNGWRDRSAEKRRFSCSVRYGRVENVYIESDRVAFSGY